MYWNDKLIHFGVGLAVGSGYWYAIERYCPIAVRRLNPILFLVMLTWGASGLFFFRKLHLPWLSGDLFYMAIPDWDIPFYNSTKLRFLIHRSWLFHSVLIPLAIAAISGWKLSLAKRQGFDRFPVLWKWLLEGAIALSVGISAHLLWDGLLSSTKRGFIIHGWSLPASFAWLAVNLAVGIAVPLAIVWALNSPPTDSDLS
jgi:hypothetical protein